MYDVFLVIGINIFSMGVWYFKLEYISFGYENVVEVVCLVLFNGC